MSNDGKFGWQPTAKTADKNNRNRSVEAIQNTQERSQTNETPAVQRRSVPPSGGAAINKPKSDE